MPFGVPNIQYIANQFESQLSGLFGDSTDISHLSHKDMETNISKPIVSSYDMP